MMQFFWKNMKKDQKGFTLVELLVVVVILGILATLAVQTIGDKSEDAKIAKAKADIRTLISALEIYKMESTDNKYPLDTDNGGTGLAALTTGNYIKSIPTDPWGSAYTYTSTDGATFLISASGPSSDVVTSDNLD